MQIGYARVSKDEQDTALQLDALKRAGVEQVFQEKRSGGSTTHRLELARMLAQLRAGDVVTVYKMDRLARSLRDLLQILDTIERRGAAFRSLTEAINTATPAGRMLMHMLGAVAEFERGIIRERSIAGVRAAVERGAVLGRPRAFKTPTEEAAAVRLVLSEKYSLSECARRYGCHLSSVKRAVRRALASVPAAA